MIQRAISILPRNRKQMAQVAGRVVLVLVAATTLASLCSSASSAFGSLCRHYLTFYFGATQIAIVLGAVAGGLWVLYLAFHALRGADSGKPDFSEAFYCVVLSPVMALFAGGGAGLLFAIPVTAGALARALILNLLLGHDVEPFDIPPLPDWWPRIPISSSGD